MLITDSAVKNRTDWIEKIRSLGGSFTEGSTRLGDDLSNDINEKGTSELVDHLRLCGDIPESYDHDSSEEKLYSKYTDCIVCEAFKSIGMRSLVLSERGDSADVEVFARAYSFVADAKSFRLSRTAKNAKDFKIQAMDNWKRGKPYAMVVCPIYQLPNTSSQIYLHATTRNVCVFSYSHLAVLVLFSKDEGPVRSEEMLAEVFKSVRALNPSKDAAQYWTAVNKTMLSFSPRVAELWDVEKRAAAESVEIAKDDALTFLAREREKIMQMSHQEALLALVRVHKIESRIKTIKSVSDNKILAMG